MSSPLERSHADRNLLFGILAVQLDFISRDDLLTSMSSWVQNKQKPLGQILVASGKLTSEQAAALDVLRSIASKGPDGTPTARRSKNSLPNASLPPRV